MADNQNNEIKVNRRTGVVQIPLRMILRQLQDAGVAADMVDTAEKQSGNRPGIVRERDGEKAELVRNVMSKNPDAPVAEIVNKAHDQRPDITKPNLRYLANKLIKQRPADQPASRRRK